MKPCLFPWGYKPWGVFHWHHNDFFIGAKFKQYTEFKFLLFSVLYMLYLEAITQGCSLKYVFFKTRQTRHTE